MRLVDAIKKDGSAVIPVCIFQQLHGSSSAEACGPLHSLTPPTKSLEVRFPHASDALLFSSCRFHFNLRDGVKT